MGVMAVITLLVAGCSGASAPSPSPQTSTKPASPSTAPASSPQSSAKPSVSTTGYANPDLLVETDWLAQKLSDPTIRIVDGRKPDEHRAGHIKGAVNIPQDTAFLPGASQGLLGTADQIAKIFGDKGITNENRVIIYDAGQAYVGSYLLWALETYGHAKVSVLNGGFKKWQKENKETTTVEPTVTPDKLTAKLDSTRRALIADVKAAVGNPKFAFVDSRSPQEYRGEQVNAKRGGHVPGAVNIDWVTLFNSDGTVKSAADLAKLYDDQKVGKDKQVIVYCQVGFRSSMGYLSMRLLGYNVAHYDASWNEWGNDANVPVEK